MSTERTASQRSADDSDFNESPPKRATVVLWLIATALLAAAIILLLLYRAVTIREPQHVIIVRGGPEWIGSSLIITEKNGARKWGAFLDESGNHSVSFFLPAGRYSLRVETSQGARALSEEFDMTKDREAEFKLPTTAPASRPTTDTSRS